MPDSDADMFMGHKGSGSHTGARYIHRKPEYLASVTQALEDAALNPLLDVPPASSTPLEDSAPARTGGSDRKIATASLEGCEPGQLGANSRAGDSASV